MAALRKFVNSKFLSLIFRILEIFYVLVNKKQAPDLLVLYRHNNQQQCRNRGYDSAKNPGEQGRGYSFSFDRIKASTFAFPLVLREKLLQGLAPSGELKPHMTRLGELLKMMQREHARNSKDIQSLHNLAGEVQSELVVLHQMTSSLIAGFRNAGKYVPINDGNKDADKLREIFTDMLRELQSQDKMINFEIQNLISRHNQAESLASSVEKKKQDTEAAIIQKIG